MSKFPIKKQKLRMFVIIEDFKQVTKVVPDKDIFAVDVSLSKIVNLSWLGTIYVSVWL